MNQQIGKISKKIIRILDLDYKEEQPIFIGEANIKHMKERHPEDFKKYGASIKDIIKDPTYLAKNEKKKSIEFIKKYKLDNDEYVLIAVRVTNNNILILWLKKKLKDILKTTIFTSFSLKKTKCMLLLI